jgi:hypothetical protein
MAPLMEVPPPKSWVRKRRGAFFVADEAPSDDLNLVRGSRPLHHGHGDRPVRSGADGLQHARVPECSDIAALLQLEAEQIDAARCVDREHKRKIGCGLCGRPADPGKQQQQCQPEAPDCGGL